MEKRHHATNRGVSEIIGAILVFGLVVMSLSLFQTTAVPASNEQVEFDHSQAVQTDLLGLDAELSDAAATGNGRTAIVTVGMDYPTRFLFRNPPPVSGTLSTAESGFTIENAAAIGDAETDDYWDGTTRMEYTSRQVVYRVDYNVYDSAPTTVLAHGVVYDRFPDGTTRRIDAGGFIDGRAIELAALDGRRDESRVGALSVPVNAQSAPTERVRVRDDPEVDDDNIRLTVQTDASADAWKSFLEDELAPEGHVVEVVRGDDPDTVDVVLEEGVTYQLQLARVSVGSPPYTPEPAYVTTDEDPDRTVLVGRPTDLSVEVRDEYNGPVAGEDVTFTIDDGDGSTTTEIVTTDDDGVATLSYTPSEAGAVDITATVDGGTGVDGDPLGVPYDLTASTGGDSGDGPESINRGDIGVYYTGATKGTGRQGNTDLDKMTVTFTSRDGTYTVQEARISFVASEDVIRRAERVTWADNPQGPNTNIVLPGPDGEADIEVAEDFSDIQSGVVIGPDEEETFVFDFDNSFRSGSSRQEFFVLSVVLEDSSGTERTQTFFIGETP